MAIIASDLTNSVNDGVSALGDSWRSSFLRIMQVQPRLNVVTIAETRFLLRLSELLARLISPAALS